MTESARRAQVFGSAAAAYARFRPGYPDVAVDWALEPVDDRRAPHLLDLGAGTGKLTASLVERPAVRVTAVDPDPEMLGELRARFPTVDAVSGSAEAIPLPDGSVDAVLVGQAFHWFDAERAIPELVRVLRPGTHDHRRAARHDRHPLLGTDQRPGPSRCRIRPDPVLPRLPPRDVGW